MYMGLKACQHICILFSRPTQKESGRFENWIAINLNKLLLLMTIVYAGILPNVANVIRSATQNFCRNNEPIASCAFADDHDQHIFDTAEGNRRGWM